MKFLIAGAGAIGGYLGARMAQAGQDVTLYARGPHLRAMQERGLRVIGDDGDFEVRPKIVGDLKEAGPMDVIFLGVKANGLTLLAPQVQPLIGENTTVVSTQNGIPWWYFQAHAGELTGLHLERVDPGGVIAAAIPAKNVVASIAYFATELVEPGVIHHTEGNRLSLGEPDGTRSDRCKAISEALIKAGIRCPVTQKIRTEIWVKILGNVAFNPISALTRATLAQMARDPEVRHVVRNIMLEVEAVAAKMGIEMPISVDQRIAGAEKVGEHKTSMLQDLESGRPMELEAVVGAVVELGERLGVAMPHTRTVYACTRLLSSHALSVGGSK
ncbi:MAG TPA: 2-dehydropantoate 2-reductase [Bryobacteraceae bacterium]|jgi:2-dehydropantoate 2-reductase|nr:2-dehydropantoate 2-reductase [Bryobacteraceae bacterium]